MKRLATLLLLIPVFHAASGQEMKKEAQSIEKNVIIKNVLLIISDDLKSDAIGAYGNKICKTPNMDKLAANGVLFNQTYCQGTVCGPSRTSFMHSRYRGNIDLNLGKHMRDNGVFSARVGKVYHMRVPGDIIAGTDGQDIKSSWDEKINSPGQEAHTPGDYACLNLNIFTTDLENRESTKMPNRMFVTVSYDGDGSDQPDYKTATKTIELMREAKGKPFFIAAGFVRPHYPMVAPKKYFDRYPWQDIELPEFVKDDLNDIPEISIPKSTSAKNGIDKYVDNQKRMWAGYYASVTFMDDQLGRILAELDKQGLRESTAVVFISDHGYHLGEHTYWQKNDLHERIVNVPMIISAPGYKAGVSMSITELVDVYPTISELLGINIPDSVQGKSLIPLMKNPEAIIKESALSFTGQGIGMRKKDWAYMRYRDGSEELYDMNKDPKQFTNLAKNLEYEDAIKRLRIEYDARLVSAEVRMRSDD
jgi:iduronate 2-sulfatase